MKHLAKKLAPRLGKRKPIAVLGLLLLVAALITGGTLAWLAVASGPVVNAFTPGNVTVDIEETFTDGVTKSNVKVKNTGNVEAYIRVAVVPTWEDGSRNAVAMAVGPNDLTYNGFPGTGWFLKDGYYYHKAPVAPSALTGVLIDSVSVNQTSAGYLAGYRMNLQILAEGIQSMPANAVTEAWGVTVTNGALAQ